MLSPRQRSGRDAERLAAAYLRREGYLIEAANVRFPVGELDLIAQDGKTLCFVEVRSRASTQFGSARESLTRAKRHHFVKAVRWYLQRRRPRWEGPIRFDVVAIQQPPGAQQSLELIRAAFDATW
ncbi:MAG: YraN family protein [Candidatus Omnitrophica bacterium]|nr:YraN family protein [Candidatus Omnitrophota bacterium]